MDPFQVPVLYFQVLAGISIWVLCLQIQSGKCCPLARSSGPGWFLSEVFLFPVTQSLSPSGSGLASSPGLADSLQGVVQTLSAGSWLSRSPAASKLPAPAAWTGTYLPFHSVWPFCLTDLFQPLLLRPYEGKTGLFTEDSSPSPSDQDFLPLLLIYGAPLCSVRTDNLTISLKATVDILCCLLEFSLSPFLNLNLTTFGGQIKSNLFQIFLLLGSLSLPWYNWQHLFSGALLANSL